MTARRPSPACPHPTATACMLSAVLPSYFRASLISGVCFAYSVVGRLFESAWIGSQAFNGAKAFNAHIGAWNTASMTTMSSVCALFHRMCVRRVCLGLGCGAAWPICHRPRPIEAAATHAFAVHSFFRASLISGAYFASSIVRKLFGSVWLGSQAFFSATAFNANIAAWNTASMTSIASVCLHCHRLSVRGVCMRRCAACLPSGGRSSLQPRMCASVFHSFLEYVCSISARLVPARKISLGLRQPQPPQLPCISTVERLHLAPHALGSLDAACTVMHRPGPSGLGAHAARAL
jgi:hypothetical protein